MFNKILLACVSAGVTGELIGRANVLVGKQSNVTPPYIGYSTKYGFGGLTMAEGDLTFTELFSGPDDFITLANVYGCDADTITLVDEKTGATVRLDKLRDGDDGLKVYRNSLKSLFEYSEVGFNSVVAIYA